MTEADKAWEAFRVNHYVTHSFEGDLRAACEASIDERVAKAIAAHEARFHGAPGSDFGAIPGPNQEPVGPAPCCSKCGGARFVCDMGIGGCDGPRDHGRRPCPDCNAKPEEPRAPEGMRASYMKTLGRWVEDTRPDSGISYARTDVEAKVEKAHKRYDDLANALGCDPTDMHEARVKYAGNARAEGYKAGIEAAASLTEHYAETSSLTRGKTWPSALPRQLRRIVVRIRELAEKGEGK